MKTLTKMKTVLLVAIFAICAIFTITACGSTETVNIIVHNGTSIVENVNVDMSLLDENATLLDAITNENYSDTFDVVYEDSDYGAYVTSIAGVEQDYTLGAYIMVYSTDNSGADDWTTEYELDGVTYYSCSDGVSVTTVSSSVKYLFILEVYSYDGDYTSNSTVVESSGNFVSFM